MVLYNCHLIFRSCDETIMCIVHICQLCQICRDSPALWSFIPLMLCPGLCPEITASLLFGSLSIHSNRKKGNTFTCSNKWKVPTYVRGGTNQKMVVISVGPPTKSGYDLDGTALKHVKCGEGVKGSPGLGQIC